MNIYIINDKVLMNFYNENVKDKEIINIELAAQFSLKQFYNDESNSNFDRTTAYIIYFWLGVSDIDIDFIFNISPFAGIFILNCLNKYGIDYFQSKEIITNNIFSKKDIKQFIRFTFDENIRKKLLDSLEPNHILNDNDLLNEYDIYRSVSYNIRSTLDDEKMRSFSVSKDILFNDFKSYPTPKNNGIFNGLFCSTSLYHGLNKEYVVMKSFDYVRDNIKTLKNTYNMRVNYKLSVGDQIPLSDWLIDLYDESNVTISINNDNGIISLENDTTIKIELLEHLPWKREDYILLFKNKVIWKDDFFSNDIVFTLNRILTEDYDNTINILTLHSMIKNKSDDYLNIFTLTKKILISYFNGDFIDINDNLKYIYDALNSINILIEKL